MTRLAICFQRHKEYMRLLKERTDALRELKAKVSSLILLLISDSLLIVVVVLPHFIPSIRGG